METLPIVFAKNWRTLMAEGSLIIKVFAMPNKKNRAKNNNNSIKPTTMEEKVLEAKEYIMAAASILRGLNTDMERVSWLLEDALTFIDDASEADDTFIEQVFSETEPQFISAASAKTARGGSKMH